MSKTDIELTGAIFGSLLVSEKDALIYDRRWCNISSEHIQEYLPVEQKKSRNRYADRDVVQINKANVAENINHGSKSSELFVNSQLRPGNGGEAL